MFDFLYLIPFLMAEGDAGGGGEGGGEGEGEGKAGEGEGGGIMKKDAGAGGEGSGEAGADWLPEDLRANEGLKKFHEGGVKSLATSYLNLEKAFQGKIPGEKATDEERAAFWNPLGRPETAEGYEIKKPENLPEGVEWSEDRLNLARAFAHKAGYTQSQFEAAVNFDTQEKINAVADSETALKTTIAENVATLKKQWGAGYDEQIKAAALTTQTFAPEGLWEKMEAAGLTSDPLIIELMASVGQGIQEGKRIKGEGSADLTLTPEEADREQRAIATDKTHSLNEAYHDRKHIDHKKAVEEFNRLSQLKRGKQPATT